MLINLLINAAEATPDGRCITISARQLSYTDSVEILVSDTGCGIPSDILKHVLRTLFYN